jgi:hypothetical protein
MRRPETCAVALAGLLVLLPAAGARSQTCIDGLCFVDRGASGEVALGFQRGGISVLDYDGDGFQDLVIANVAGQLNRLFRNVPDPARPGERTFTDVTAGSGLDDADGTSRQSRGIVAGDIDNDGDPDLFMTGYPSADGSSALLYRNDGGGVFTNVSVAAGVRTTGDRPDSASFADFDLDGDLDLLVAGGASVRTLRLLRNQGAGTFTDATTLLPTLPSVSNLYGMLWTDFDGDGDPDCVTLKPSPGPALLRNEVDAQGARYFVDVAAAVGFTTLGPAPMGITGGDYDNDGDVDLAITDAVVGTYYRNDGGLLTRIYPFASMWGWGTTWIDADNDGDLDQYHVGSLGQGPNFDRLFRNLGGGLFDDVSAAVNSTYSVSQYAVQLDVDNDGRQEMVTINLGTPVAFVSVYDNVSTTPNHWIKLRLVGTGGANRDAIGARVRVTAAGFTQTREIVSGSSTSSTEDLRAHFGLGAASVVDAIEVVWPRAGVLAARTETYPGPIPVDQILTLLPHALEACRNGIDDDGDGAIDHPADVGCTSPTDVSERPECGDGFDNDADGLVDLADPQCIGIATGAQESTSCGLGVELALVLPLLAAVRWRAWGCGGRSQTSTR